MNAGGLTSRRFGKKKKKKQKPIIVPKNDSVRLCDRRRLVEMSARPPSPLSPPPHRELRRENTRSGGNDVFFLKLGRLFFIDFLNFLNDISLGKGGGRSEILLTSRINCEKILGIPRFT